MIDNIVGHPSLLWRRRETLAVLLFSLWCIGSSSRRGPRLLYIRKLNRALQRFSPWQIIATTLTSLYALTRLDRLFGLNSPEHPPAYLYTNEYNRATWIVNALDAGFATAMSIQPKWLRDICSIIFSVYYIVHGDEADSKMHKFREVCTVDMLRATWNKTNNPYIRAITRHDRPRLPVHRKVVFQRPASSRHTRPVTAWLFFAGTEAQLADRTQLILDFPGGGFVAMGPAHHEERLRAWALKTGRPVLSVDYGKAPEYPYPYGIEEGFDVYQVLCQTQGRVLGMSGSKLSVIMSGDSAGGNLAVNVMLKILETEKTLALARPAGLALTYAALNFSFSSWAWPTDPAAPAADAEHATSAAHVLSCPPLVGAHIGGLGAHDAHIGLLPDGLEDEIAAEGARGSVREMAVVHRHTNASLFDRQQEVQRAYEAVLRAADAGAGEGDAQAMKKPLVEPKLTMSSKTGYLHDRIITPGMMWAMALLYIGPRWKPGMETDYHVSPLLAPAALLAEFPPLLLQCGGRDPLVDDTVLFAGRVRQAKLMRQNTAAAAAPVSMSISVVSESEKDNAACNGNGNAGGEGFEYLSSHAAGVSLDEHVKMQIFPGWSHGYLQMSTLMHEARVAIDDIADWIGGAFERHDAQT